MSLHCQRNHIDHTWMQNKTGKITYRLAQLLDQRHRLPFQPPLKPTSAKSPYKALLFSPYQNKRLKDLERERYILKNKKNRDLLRARALNSLASSSVDMSKRASKSTPLKLNFLNVLFFGCPAAAPAATPVSTSACAHKQISSKLFPLGSRENQPRKRNRKTPTKS